MGPPAPVPGAVPAVAIARPRMACIQGATGGARPTRALRPAPAASRAPPRPVGRGRGLQPEGPLKAPLPAGRAPPRRLTGRRRAQGGPRLL